MARQLASEGYDVDPEDLNTLWEAARRDIVQGERPVNTAELTRRGEGTAELEQRLTAPEVATEFTPDTADLRQVREFGREPVEPGLRKSRRLRRLLVVGSASPVSSSIASATCWRIPCAPVSVANVASDYAGRAARARRN